MHALLVFNNRKVYLTQTLSCSKLSVFDVQTGNAGCGERRWDLKEELSYECFNVSRHELTQVPGDIRLLNDDRDIKVVRVLVYI